MVPGLRDCSCIFSIFYQCVFVRLREIVLDSKLPLTSLSDLLLSLLVRIVIDMPTFRCHSLCI